jgi:ATP/maltotriose-dependent transcriptional regulator MalT
VRVESAYVLGVLAFWKGRLEESEHLLTKAIESYRPERHREHVTLYAQDPKVVCLSRLAWTLWHRGRVAEARARRDEAFRLAERHGDPLGLAYAQWFTMFIAIDEGDVERMRAQIESLERSATTHRLLYIEAVMDVFAAYLATVNGEARAGIERMRATLADPRWLGMEYVLKGQTLVLIARAAAAAGDARSATATVAEAIDYLGPGASIWKAPLRRIEARMIALEDRTGDRALPAFEAALATAREYGSAWSELGVAIDRARWTLEHSQAPTSALADLEQALRPYADAPTMTATATAHVLIENQRRGAGPQRGEARPENGN